MADFSSLKQTIQAYIKQNGNEEITGNILQDVLLAIVTTIGDGAINSLTQSLQNEITARGNADTTLQGNIATETTARQQADTALGGRIDGLQTTVNSINTKLAEGYIYAGIATPSTNPGSISGKVFYIATVAGTYTNFSGIMLTQGINILKYNGSAWSSEQVIGIDDEPTDESQNLILSSAVHKSLQDYNYKLGTTDGIICLKNITGTALKYGVDYTNRVLFASSSFRCVIIPSSVLAQGFAFNGGDTPSGIYTWNNNPLNDMTEQYSRELRSSAIHDGYYIPNISASEKYIVLIFAISNINNNYCNIKLKYSEKKNVDVLLGFETLEITYWNLTHYLDANGVEQQLYTSNANSYAVADSYYEISANDVLFTNIICNVLSGICFYDESKSFITSIRTSSNNMLYKVPDNANIKYFRIASSGLVNSLANGYELFVRKKISNIYPVFWLNNNGKLDITFNPYYAIMPIGDHSSIAGGTYFEIQNVTTREKYAACDEYIPVNPEQKYVVSNVFYPITGIAFYDADKQFISGINSELENDILTIPNNSSIKFMRIGFYRESGIDASTCYIAKYQGINELFIEKNLNRIINLENKGLSLNDVDVAILGDSISAFKDASGKTWSDYFAEVTGATIHNFAIGGTCLRAAQYPTQVTTLAEESAAIQISGIAHAIAANDYTILNAAIQWRENNGYPSSTDSLTQRLIEIYNKLTNLDFSKVKIVIVFGGQNDYTEGVQFGDADSQDTITLNGAINDICTRLQTAYPNIHLVYLTPIAGYAQNTFTDAYWEGTFQIGGHTKVDVVNCIIDAANRNMLPVWEMYWKIGINKVNFFNYFPSNDGHHPRLGFNYIGRKIASFIESILKYF